MRYKPQAAFLGLALSAACLFAGAVPTRVQAADAPIGDAMDGMGGLPSATASGVQATAAPASTAAVTAVPSPVVPPPAAPAAPPRAFSGSLEDKLVELQNQLDDQEGDIRAMDSALVDVRNFSGLSSGQAAPIRISDEAAEGGAMPFGLPGDVVDAPEETTMVWRRLSLLVNTDVEFTREYNEDPASKKGTDLGDGNTPDFIQSASPDGEEGAFFKHIDVHFKYKFDDSMFAKLDYNFAALELDDVGIGWENLPIFSSDYTYSVFVGQKLQSFGIEQQEDDRYLMFPDRAMMFGGHNPFAHVAHPTADPFDLFDQNPTVSTGLAAANEDDASDGMINFLVFKRVMGLHLYQTHDFGFLAYTLGADIVNDESEESQDGQVTDSLQLGFPLQTQDQDVSEIGRVGIEPRILDDLIGDLDRPLANFEPGFLKEIFDGGRLHFGASAFHDPENTAFHAGQPSQEEWADAQGLDGTFVDSRNILYIQTEYVKRDQFGPSFDTATWLPNNVYGGMQGQAESYYVAASIQPWRFLDPKSPRVELLARYEGYYYDELANWLRLALGSYTGSFNACTVGIKYTYAGNCHTSVNYTSYGLNNNFGALGATSYLHIEEQVNF